jgi:hypothetical protein
MAYIGRVPQTGAYQLIDDISGSFNGILTSFTLQSGSQNISVETEQSLIISISGVVQYPNTAYTVSGNTITFTSAPLATDTFSGVLLGNVFDIGTPTDATVGQASLSSTFISQNAQTFNNITIGASKNASAAGPITVSGTLTIPSGSTFVIV